MQGTTDLLWPPGRRRLLLLLLGVVAYGPVIRTPFLWDDHTMIEANSRLSGWSLPQLRHDFSTDVFEGHGDGYYRPLQTIVNRMDYTIWGLRPVGFHITNLLAHLACALLLEELLLLLNFSLLQAFICASLFIVHPVPVEELMIIAGRAELFGFAATLACLIVLLKARGAQAPATYTLDASPREPAAAGRIGWAWMLGSYACFIVALGFKESAAVTPLLAALLLWWRREKLLAYLPLAGYLLLLIPYFWWRARVVGPALPPFDLQTNSDFFFKLFPYICWRYAVLVVWPWNLHSHHVVPHIQPIWILQGLLAVGGIAALVARRSSLGLFALAWFLISLLPKAPIMMYGHFVLDHWAYPASVGILLPLSVWFAHSWRHPSARGARGAMLLYIVLLIAYALLTRLNLELRGSDEKMYRWALHFSTSNPIKHNLGLLLLDQGRAEEAISFLSQVRGVYPDDPDNNYALAKAFDATGHRRAAINLLSEILQRHPDYALAKQTLASLQPASR